MAKILTLRFMRQFVIPFGLVLAAYWGAGRFWTLRSPLLPWEVASIWHTFTAAYGLMERDAKFVDRNVLRRVRKFGNGVLLGVLMSKALCTWAELDHEFFTGHPSLLITAGYVSPHLMIVPAVVFFVINLVLLANSHRVRASAHILVSDFERELEGLITRVDLPIVLSYVVVVSYSYIMLSDPSQFVRGMACSLLLVSNLLTTSFEVNTEDPRGT